MSLTYGDTVTWEYNVTNTGNEPLRNIAAIDDMEGNITCPKTTLDVGESMTCTSKTGTADQASYENIATVTAEGNITGTDVNDTDPSHYQTTATPVAHIGDYFWIDENHNGLQDPGEKPVKHALVELFDEQGNPITDIHGNHSVYTDANGKYGFDVEPGRTYRVRFHIPEDLRRDEYIFTYRDRGSDTRDSDVNSDGFTAGVTPGAGENILSLDAGIDCGCDRSSNDSGGGSALGLLSGLMMLLLSLTTGLWMVRRQEIAQK